MPSAGLLTYDAASAISQGARDYQEDAIICDFSSGSELCFSVLADGMGGHAAGDLASKIVVTEMFSELTFRRQELLEDQKALGHILRHAAETANECLAGYVEDHPDTKGMGSTLLSSVILQDQLYWISIGDSPLFLFRDNQLTQLNEDHSLGPHIDMLVEKGALSEEEGHAHPERNALTSALLGQKIARVDCPATPVDLQSGDTVILASDGLQFLSDDEIAEVVRDRPMCRSSDIADGLMQRLEQLADPDQDNISLAVVQVRNAVARSDGAVRAADDVPESNVLAWPFRSRDQSAAQSVTRRR